VSEDFNDWQQRQRVQQDRWDYATSSGQYAPQPSAPIDWSSPSPSPSPPQSWSPESAGGGSYSGGHSSSSGSSGPTFLSIIPWIPALPVLYPLPFSVAFAGAGVGYGILESQFEVYTSDGRIGLGIGSFLIGAVLFFAMSRLDHRLAASKLWRIPRHVLRLALVAIVAQLVATSLLQAPGQSVATAGFDVAQLGNPVVLVSVAASSVLAHILLTRARVQEWWHDRLVAAWLRSAD
jgi:hypothetical protein